MKMAAVEMRVKCRLEWTRTIIKFTRSQVQAGVLLQKSCCSRDQVKDMRGAFSPLSSTTTSIITTTTTTEPSSKPFQSLNQ
jgi:hypothetical protein